MRNGILTLVAIVNLKKNILYAFIKTSFFYSYYAILGQDILILSEILTKKKTNCYLFTGTH